MASEKAISAAAKAIDPDACWSPNPTWKPAKHLIERWQHEARVKARRALDAAAAVDGDAGWNEAIEEAATVGFNRAMNATQVFDAIRSLKRLK